MKNKAKIIILILLLSLKLTVHLRAQDNDKISPYLVLQYFKDTDDQKYLKTTLTWSHNRMELPVAGMNIAFYYGPEKKFFSSVTGVDGVAKCPLPGQLPADKNGYWEFSTTFDGNDTIEAASAELLIRDAVLEMTLSEIDSIKTISLIATRRGESELTPLSGEYVYVYVPRMFSLLLLGEVILDDSGSGSLVFPADLPGDKEGNITIIARLEEHPDYGNVERKSTLTWGKNADYSYPEGHRALWTKTAPKWMIYTLSVLLTGVWAHYLYAIISLIRIRRDAKKQALKAKDGETE